MLLAPLASSPVTTLMSKVSPLDWWTVITRTTPEASASCTTWLSRKETNSETEPRPEPSYSAAAARKSAARLERKGLSAKPLIQERTAPSYPWPAITVRAEARNDSTPSLRRPRSGEERSNSRESVSSGNAAARNAASKAVPSGLSLQGLDFPSSETGIPLDWRSDAMDAASSFLRVSTPQLSFLLQGWTSSRICAIRRWIGFSSSSSEATASQRTYPASPSFLGAGT